MKYYLAIEDIEGFLPIHIELVEKCGGCLDQDNARFVFNDERSYNVACGAIKMSEMFVEAIMATSFPQ